MEFDIQRFEDAAKENGIRYWLAHEFMKELGYESWNSFQSVITKSMSSCAKLNIDVTEVFIPDSYMDNGKEQKTFRLTRFACFLVTMHADTRKPQVATYKTVLAAIADKLISQRIAEGDFGRIETREDLKFAEKIMTHEAQQAGLQSTQFGIFKDAGFRGMYNMGLRDLMHYKGVDGNNVLYDFMGLDELAGNLFRVTQTAARIKRDRGAGPSNVNHLANTARSVGQEVRDMMIKNSGLKPENLQISEDISKVKRRIKDAHRQMTKLDAPKKTKKKLPQ